MGWLWLLVTVIWTALYRVDKFIDGLQGCTDFPLLGDLIGDRLHIFDVFVDGGFDGVDAGVHFAFHTGDQGFDVQTGEEVLHTRLSVVDDIVRVVGQVAGQVDGGGLQILYQLGELGQVTRPLHRCGLHCRALQPTQDLYPCQVSTLLEGCEYLVFSRCAVVFRLSSQTHMILI